MEKNTSQPSPPQTYVPPAPTRTDQVTGKLNNILDVVNWLKGLICVWFLRVAWFPCLCWGLYDLYMLFTAGEAGASHRGRESDASIRITVGVILGLCWFFLARRWGRWTLNRGGILETPPWKRTT
ncbi:MAG: hypothetical protein IT462_00150 [Planctomycetes bacterium]|nr:hypothetical protein [Planctomycetota bacterium]